MDIEANKTEVVTLIRELMGAVPLHQKALTTFCKGDKEKLEMMESSNEKIGVIIHNKNTEGERSDGDIWGINPLTLFNTILSTLVGDELHYVTDKEGYVKEVMWASRMG